MSLMVCPECDHDWDQDVDDREIVTCSKCESESMAIYIPQLGVTWTGLFQLELIDEE